MLLCIFPWEAALAQIDIKPKVAEIQEEQAVVWVSNTGDTPEFVNITLYQVTNPGVPPEEEQMIPIGLIKEPFLYATPFKLSLGPRQENQVQLNVLKQPDKEKVYRLAVIPQQKASISGTNNNVMLVSLGFNGLVRQLPANQTATWQSRCGEQGLQLEATGTVRVEFSDLQQDGQAIDNFNVYPDTPRLISAQTLSGKAQNKPFTLRCEAGKK
ncbi:hypothetical protein Z042_13920 [Chania multitudinisentens RB-25]|uniref:Pilus assembly protein n=1 Tax=Chania multitudinisentens RB-25 TaxID=1441930 RepID=W0LDX8_9GAMM|nr:hypothetical protein Z042_13920 [Chania multitudinisentens RB-25]